MRRVKIMQMTDCAAIGGGNRYVLYHAENLNPIRYELLVLCTEETAFMDEFIKRRIKTSFINTRRWYDPLIILRMRNLIVKKRIDIVHTQGARCNIYGRIAARIAGAPVVVSTVQNSIYDFPINPLKRIIYITADRLTSHLTDKIVCVARSLADDLIHKERIKPAKVVVISNPIDSREFDHPGDTSYLLNEFKIKPAERKIGVIGRMTEQKGHIYFLKAIARVKDECPDIKCLIVGDGPLRENLETMVKDLGISNNCIFTGVRYDIPEILSLLDVLVLSSVSEGLPFVLLEAMAAKCPIVATKVSGVPELIEDGKDGILVLPKDSSALAQAIIQQLQDGGKARQMALTARKKVEEKFNANRMVAKTEKVYEQLLVKKNIL